MARKRRIVTPLPTIGHVPDELWERIEPVRNELDPPAKTGRRRIEPRRALDGVIYHLRTGCQGNVLPKEFGDDSSVHRTYHRWIDKGVLDRVWALLGDECEELGGVDGEWQAVDGALGKARFGGALWVPTPRTAAKEG